MIAVKNIGKRTICGNFSAPDFPTRFRESVNCPKCTQDVLINSVFCIHCGYHLGIAKELFGFEDVHFHPLTDLADCLRKDERDSLVELISDLERRFPQLWFGICFVGLPERTSLREFGFWLLNHAAVVNGDPMRPNENGVLLSVDLTSRAAGLTLGYFVERFLSDGDLFRSLNAGARQLAKGEFETGVRRTIDRFAKILARRARVAARRPEKFARLQPVEPEELKLQPIRQSPAAADVSEVPIAK
ncbi:MAG: hypothetical protein ACI8UO_005868 [Verrucomicrobiales bacterium]